MVAVCRSDLADDLADTGRFDEAEKHYDAALAVARAIDARRLVGVVFSQLGNLALRRGDLAEARRRYTEALATFRGLGEPQSEALAWHHLGVVAQEAKNWDEAERCCRESLRLTESYNDLPGVARTYNLLALVAEGAGRPADAERWYLREIEIDEKLANPKELAMDYSNLAYLYLSQGRLDEAGRYARRAVEIKETLDLSSEPWKTYDILASIAVAQGRPDEAAGWRRKEQESYAAYAGAAHGIREWAPLIQAVVAGCAGNTQASEQARALLQQFEEGWPTAVAAVRRILHGERDSEVLRQGLPYQAFVVVHSILARLAGDTLAPTPSPNSGKGQGEREAQGERAGQGGRTWGEQKGITLDDLLGLVKTACSPAAPAGLGEQLFGLTRTLAGDARMPAEVRGLGRVLNEVLAGKRDPDLSALPPELADKVRAMLAGL